MSNHPPLEKTIVKNILKFLNSLPNTRAKKIPGTQYSSGWPDIISVTDGTVVFIEVKRPKVGRITPLQQAELAAWAGAGAVTMVATSVAEVEDVLLATGVIA
jgi:hypothetical protein